MRVKNHMEIEKNVIYLLVTFIEGHDRAEKNVVSEEIDDAGRKLLEESREQKRRAQAWLDKQPPELVDFVRHEWAIRVLLDAQADQIGEFQNNGIVSDADAHHMMHDLEHDMLMTEKVDNKWSLKERKKSQVAPAGVQNA